MDTRKGLISSPVSNLVHLETKRVKGLALPTVFCNPNKALKPHLSVSLLLLLIERCVRTKFVTPIVQKEF